MRPHLRRRRARGRCARRRARLRPADDEHPPRPRRGRHRRPLLPPPGRARHPPPQRGRGARRGPRRRPGHPLPRAPGGARRRGVRRRLGAAPAHPPREPSLPGGHRPPLPHPARPAARARLRPAAGAAPPRHPHQARRRRPRGRRGSGDRAPVRDCVIVGGGVAGVAAALAAADRGWRPLLLERGPVLGGMARSHPDRQLGGELDCGQHVVLACCTEHRALLRRLGTDHLVPLAPRLDVLVVDERGRRARLGESPLAAPLHLGPALVRMPFLGHRDRLAIAGAVLRLRTVRDLDRLDGVDLATWLGAAARGPRRRAFWDLVTIATCNLTTAEVSAAVGSRLLEPAAAVLAAHGGEVRLGAAADRVLAGDGAVRGVRTAAGEVIPAARVIVAGPPALLARVAPEVAAEPVLAPAQRLDVTPILNLVLRFDRPVLDAPLLAVWDSPLQWLFSRSRLCGEAGDGETVVCSLSAATELADLPGEKVRDRLLPHLQAAQPRSGAASLIGWHVTRERAATASLRPGTAALRLGPATPVTGLALAGSWTATGWPVTMEGAARSGRAAVEHLVATQRWSHARTRGIVCLPTGTRPVTTEIAT
ncbi:MAG: FAD-dependent oxidoreductase [Chloroflexi bacterium]|nr:MAG: FAD-dependent oxidoreductase [Chloroflexota bacterium]